MLGHDCEALTQDGDGVEVTVRNLTDGTARSIRGGYVMAADGGSSQIRSRLDAGFVGRTYEDRWVIIDTKVHRGWDSVDRLRFYCDPVRPAVDRPTPLGHHRWEFPVLPGEDEQTLVSHDYIWQLPRRYGRTPGRRRDSPRRRPQPPRALRRTLAGRPGVPRRRRRARDAAVDR